MDQNKKPKNPFPYGSAICYSGFRTGHKPGAIYPSYHQVKEDLTY